MGDVGISGIESIADLISPNYSGTSGFPDYSSVSSMFGMLGLQNTSTAAKGNGCSKPKGDTGGSSRAESDHQMRDSMVDGNCKKESEGKEKGEGKTSGNWLVVLAGSLATVQCKFLDAAMEDMRTMEENSAGATQKDTSEMTKEKKQKVQQDQDAARDKFVKAQSRYQANTQMFSMVADMTATSLKSLGEGLTAIARKQ
jgi:hypothetical protein